jgi:hypothetical protein
VLTLERPVAASHGTIEFMSEVTQELLTKWAYSCLRINHLNTLVPREISKGSLHRAAELSERARGRAWDLFNEMVAAGASKPADYREPDET